MRVFFDKVYLQNLYEKVTAAIKNIAFNLV